MFIIGIWSCRDQKMQSSRIQQAKQDEVIITKTLREFRSIEKEYFKKKQYEKILEEAPPMIEYFENLSEKEKKVGAIYIPELYLILGYAYYYQQKNYVEAINLFDKEVKFYNTYGAALSLEWVEDNYVNVSQIIVEYYGEDILRLKDEFKNLYNVYHPQTVDLDGDGIIEIVIPYFNVGEIVGHDEHTGFIVYDQTEELGKYSMYKYKIEENPYAKITLEDVDKDGKVEIILAPIISWNNEINRREYFRVFYRYDGQGSITKIGKERIPYSKR